MKQIDFKTLDQIAQSNLTNSLVQQMMQNIQTTQVPTQTGYIPKPVVLPIMENAINRQENVKMPPIGQSVQQPLQLNHTEDIYYLAINDKQIGPFTLQQMKDFIAAGMVSLDVLCWAPGFLDWKAISTIKEFV